MNIANFIFQRALTVFMALTTAQTLAQTLPATSRNVFKCEVAGRITYSDTPCLSATKIEVEPTRGLNKSSGRELIGNDVRREQNREMVAEAIRPITGMDARQLDTQGRRMKLSADDQRVCRRLDTEITQTEREEKSVLQTKEQSGVQERLFQLRRRFVTIRC